MVVIIATPWSSAGEWRRVAALLYSEDSTIENYSKALEILLMWKTRVGRDIPVAIEATEILFRAAVADSEAAMAADVLGLENVRTLYCMAVIRFVNYVNELGQGGPNKRAIHEAVAPLGVPMWVVKIRHAATHQEIPSLETLRMAAKFCRTWLWHQYWSGNPPESRPSDDLANFQQRCHRSLLTFERIRREQILDNNGIICLPNGPQGPKTKKSTEKTKKRFGFGSKSGFAKCLAENSGVTLKILCSEGHLLLNSAQSEAGGANFDDFRVPLHVQKFWEPILSAIVTKNLIEELLGTLLNRLLALESDGFAANFSEIRQIIAWIRLIFDEFQKKNWSRTKIFKNFEANFSNFLRFAFKHSDLFGRDFLVKLIENLVNNKTQKVKLMKLCDIATIPTIDMIDENDEKTEKFVLHSAEILKKLVESAKGNANSEPKQSKFFGTKRWSKCPDPIWAQTPLGCLPNQTEPGNLELNFDGRKTVCSGTISSNAANENFENKNAEKTSGTNSFVIAPEDIEIL